MWAASVSQENYMSVGLLTWEQMENNLANPSIKMFNNKFFLTKCFSQKENSIFKFISDCYLEQ